MLRNSKEVVKKSKTIVEKSNKKYVVEKWPYNPPNKKFETASKIWSFCHQWISPVEIEGDPLSVTEEKDRVGGNSLKKICKCPFYKVIRCSTRISDLQQMNSLIFWRSHLAARRQIPKSWIVFKWMQQNGNRFYKGKYSEKKENILEKNLSRVFLDVVLFRFDSSTDRDAPPWKNVMRNQEDICQENFQFRKKFQTFWSGWVEGVARLLISFFFAIRKPLGQKLKSEADGLI